MSIAILAVASYFFNVLKKIAGFKTTILVFSELNILSRAQIHNVETLLKKFKTFIRNQFWWFIAVFFIFVIFINTKNRIKDNFAVREEII